MRLADKVAIITGGAGGIGAAAAQLFTEQGASVLVVDRDEEMLRDVTRAIGSPRLAYVVGDVTDPASVDACTRAAVERFGGLDIAVLNAGIMGSMTPLDDYTIEEFDRVMAINLRGVWLGVKSVAQEMKKRGGGSIVITSSIQGLSAYPMTSPYTCSKHGVVGLMRGAALEYARHNIRVNTVNPGFTDTPMMWRAHDIVSPENPEAARDLFVSTLPMRRYAQPREVANMMLFLASDDASYCSGSTYVVDGGMLASWTAMGD